MYLGDFPCDIKYRASVKYVMANANPDTRTHMLIMCHAQDEIYIDSSLEKAALLG